MIFVLGMVMLSICFAVSALAYKSRDARQFVLAILSLFTAGYFILPLGFRDLSDLRLVDESLLASAVFMSLVFYACVVLGTLGGNYAICRNIPRKKRLSYFDSLLSRYSDISFVCFQACYWVYISYATLTVYQAGGVEAFIADWNQMDAVFAFLGNLGAAFSALILAANYDQRGRKRNAIFLLFFFLPLVALVITAQRNAVLLPFVYLSVAFAVTGKVRFAFRAIMLGALVIVLISPVLVNFREAAAGDRSFSFLSAVGQISGGHDGWLVFRQSLIDRADILYNMTVIIQKIEYIGYANAEYFDSILLKFVPGLLLDGKPVAMSTSGDIGGHLSVIAWYLIKDDASSLGSLTVFGAITAFREGGWLWVPINGLMTGFLFAFLFRIFALSFLWLRVFYVIAFPALCVQNVPPSAFQVVTSLSPIFWTFIIMAACDRVLSDTTMRIGRGARARRVSRAR